MPSPPHHLIYALCEDGAPFYIGKSTEGTYRARKHASVPSLRQDDRSNHQKAARIRQLQAARGGLGYEIKVIAELPAPPRGASAAERLPFASALGLLERVTIRAMRATGAVLLNRTDGGENVVGTFSGRSHTAEVRARISASKRGFKHSAESLRRMSEAKKGNQYSRKKGVVSNATKATLKKQQT